MSPPPPLASLRRNALQVRFYDRLGGLPVEVVPTPEPAPAPLPNAAEVVRASLNRALPVSPAEEAVAASLQSPLARVSAAPPSVPAARREDPPDDEHLERRTRFWRQLDAERYLQFWRGDADAMRTLRFVLHRTAQGAALFARDNELAIRQLAAQLARGALLLTENLPPPPPPMPPVRPKASAAASPATAAPPAPALGLALEPISPPDLPLLPILEEVQIEGAEVLPEIEQTLAQVDLAIGEIGSASVSLEPTPSKIPDIQAATANASVSITATLDAL